MPAMTERGDHVGALGRLTFEEATISRDPVSPALPAPTPDPG